MQRVAVASRASGRAVERPAERVDDAAEQPRPDRHRRATPPRDDDAVARPDARRCRRAAPTAAMPSRKPTTSTGSGGRPARRPTSQISPTRARGPADSISRPTARTTRPMTRHRVDALEPIAEPIERERRASDARLVGRTRATLSACDAARRLGERRRSRRGEGVGRACAISSNCASTPASTHAEVGFDAAAAAADARVGDDRHAACRPSVAACAPRGRLEIVRVQADASRCALSPSRSSATRAIATSRSRIERRPRGARRGGDRQRQLHHLPLGLADHLRAQRPSARRASRPAGAASPRRAWRPPRPGALALRRSPLANASRSSVARCASAASARAVVERRPRRRRRGTRRAAGRDRLERPTEPRERADGRLPPRRRALDDIGLARGRAGDDQALPLRACARWRRLPAAPSRRRAAGPRRALPSLPSAYRRRASTCSRRSAGGSPRWRP